MSQYTATMSPFRSAYTIAELIYYETVHDVRQGDGNAIVALLKAIMQTIVMVALFYAINTLFGLRASPIRGDFTLYIMSGVFMFMTHVKAVGSVMSTPTAAAANMQHAPMTTAISIAAKALSALYMQLFAIFVILFFSYTLINPFTIHDPIGSLGILILAWLSGVAVGLVFYAVKPWFPGFASIGSMIYMRLNMIASGKMFVANMMPASKLAIFDWNPLFHIIDQGRGLIFNNYFPQNSNLAYPIWISIILIAIGLMGEFYTRKHISVSWSARQ